MTDSKYKIIPRNRIDHSDIDDDEYDVDSADNYNNDETITIIPSSSSSSDKMRNKNNQNDDIMNTPAAILAIVMIYFAFSIGLTFYQRELLKNYHFPFAIVLYHLILKLVISALIRVAYKCCTGKSRIHIDWIKSFRKLASVGVAAGIDIGFSNCGLELVTISLYTMIKSTSIIFILFFAILFGLEKKSWSLMTIVILISAGLFMFTYKAAQFNLLGFSFILIASMSSGVRWTFAQFVMQKTKLGLHNPIDMIYFMQPWMILPLLPLTIGFEGDVILDLLNALTERITDETIYAFAHITIGAILAFAMEVSEFLLLSYTSSLTLSIAGIFKEIFLLILAVVLNGDQMSIMNIFGLTICLGGISLHVIHKFFISKPSHKQPMINENGSTVLTKTYEQNMLLNSPSAGGLKHNNIRLNKYSTSHKTPLLDDAEDILHSDSDASHGHNTSDVLFDVLKRRDLRR